MQEENSSEQHEREERSIGELFAELSQKTTTLVRQEIQLAKVEMSQKASRVGKNVGFLVIGGVVAYTGLLAVVAAGIIVLGEVIAYWLSAAIIGVVIAAVGAVLVVKGANTLRQEEPTPRETVETLQEDKEWLRRRGERPSRDDSRGERGDKGACPPGR
jgi:uncharacterized membrane protein YqjE